MSNEALIKIALDTLKCSQKELALKVGVSPTQITQWKQGEYMSSVMETKLRELCNIGSHFPEFVLTAGSAESADKWSALMLFLAESAMDGDETGYDSSYVLRDTPEILCSTTFEIMQEIGIKIPTTFPEELNVDGNEDWSEEKYEMLLGSSDGNYAISTFISSLYKSTTNIFGFYQAFMLPWITDLRDINAAEEYDVIFDDLDASILELAAAKMEIDEVFAPQFRKFEYATLKSWGGWIEATKQAAFRYNIPLKAELSLMISESSDVIGVEAESEGLGFNKHKLHPDIYMNELLVGMKTLHQILPLILKKLEIDPDEIHEAVFGEKPQ